MASIRKLWALAAAVFLFSVLDAKGAEPPVSVTLHTASSTVKSGDEIRVELSMTNNSASPVYFVHRPRSGFTENANNFNITVPGGGPAIRITEDDDAGSWVTDPLEPGEEIREIDYLGHLFNMTAPGIYIIQVAVHVGPEGH